MSSEELADKFLYGIPISIKDCFHMKDLTTSGGTISCLDT